MPSPSAASEIAKGTETIKNLLTVNSELEQSTESTTDDSVQVDTPQGDTKQSNILKVQQGDREVELQILTEDVDAESLRLGYLADSDYRQKTMDLAEKRKGYHANADELEKVLTDARAMFEVDATALESDTELRDNDPEEYLRRLEDLKSRSGKIKAYSEAKEKAKADQAQGRTEAELELLSAALPSWLDESHRTKDIQMIGSQLSTMGYSQAEIGDMTDHRFMLMARKAALFDEIQNQDLSGKRDKTPAKSLTPGTKRTTEDQISDAERTLRDNLKASGKMKDAAGLFKQFLIKR